MSIQDPYLVNVDLDVHLRDARHAHQLYTEHSMAAAPKTKFLYHVVFQPNVGAVAAGDATNSNSLKFQKEIGVLCKSIELPQYRVSVDNKQQYNRKKNVQTRIDYQDVTIKLHDDNVGMTRGMLEEYYRYYFRDGNNDPTKGSFMPRDKYSPDVPKYGLDNDTIIPFFKDIRIYQLARREWFSYTLINPLVTQWGHDTLDNADGSSFMENSLAVAYEGVIYDHGTIDDNEPVGFTDQETRYDNVPSPLGYWDEGLAIQSAKPTLLRKGNSSSTPSGLLGRIAGFSQNPVTSVQGDASSLPGALPGYLVPTQDTQRSITTSRLSSFVGRVSDGDSLIRKLDQDAAANQSFLARSLNSGIIEELDYSGYRRLDNNSQSAVENDVKELVRNGDKKLQSFAQEAINQSANNRTGSS